MKDPLVRRFISASFFSGAFIWVAVYFFDVETEVVKALFIFSLIFVIGLIVVGLTLTPFVMIFRSKPTLLSKLEDVKDLSRYREGE